MLRLYYLLLTCIVLLVHSLAGQSVILPKAPLAQRIIGAAGQDEFVSLAINWRGDIAAAGHAVKGQHGGQDISVVVFNAQLDKIAERRIGRNADDGCGQIAVLPDGRYIIAGYSSRPSGAAKTRNKYFGKRDGWLLILNERGETEHEIILGTPDDDAFVALAVSPAGAVTLAGNSGKKAWLVHLDADFQVIWDKKLTYHQLETEAVAAQSAPNGDFFVVGGVEEYGRKHLWLAAVDVSGKIIMEKTYPVSQAEKGTGIVYLDDNSLAITGNVTDPIKRENSFISFIDRSGVIRSYQPLGGKEFDAVYTMVALHSGQLLLGGGSASFERGSRRIAAWLNLVQQDATIMQEQYYGSKLDDEVAAIAEHPDGRLFAAGMTARQVLKMRQGWLFQLTAQSLRKAKAGTLEFLVGNIHYPMQRKYLLGERTFISFSAKNNGEKGQCNLRAVVKPEDSKVLDWIKLPAGQSVILPVLPAGKTIEWGLPMQFDPRIPPGVYRFSVQFYQEQTAIGTPQSISIVIGQSEQPQLTLKPLMPDTALCAGREQWLFVEVHNTGAGTAKGVSLSVTAIGLQAIPAPALLGDLAPGAKVLYSLPFTPAILSDTLALHLRVTDISLLYAATVSLNIPLRPIDVTPVPTTNKPDYTVAVWVYPNPDNFDRSSIVWTQEEITVQIKVVSNQPVNKQQFCLEINGEPCTTGAKFEEVKIKGNQTSKTFLQTIKLREGENLLKASIQQTAGKVNSEVLKIVYNPSKPNLHIISIGVPAADLKYTSNDARDFALAISDASNIAFEKIFLDTLLTEGLTTKTEILKSLRRLQYRYNDLQILPKDLLVIFVSGHGILGYDGHFRLAASDYDSPFMEETSLDFEQDLLNYLELLPCRKVFFVDACHSGTTSGAGLAGIASRKHNLNMLLSCQSDEYSYEDDNWQHGAFTRALLDGFSAFTARNSWLGSSTDTTLDIAEIYKFIQKEIPALVDRKKPRPKTSQRPSLFLLEPTHPLILFQVK